MATGTWSRILFSTCPISTRVSSTFVLNNRVDYSKQTSRKNSVVKGKISILKQKKVQRYFCNRAFLDIFNQIMFDSLAQCKYSLFCFVSLAVMTAGESKFRFSIDAIVLVADYI